MLLGLRPRPLEMQLTALLISHGRDIRRVCVIIMAVMYVVQESHYVLRLYFILLLLLVFFSNAILRGH